MTTYTEAVDYLYSRLPVFQKEGARAFHPGLSGISQLCSHLGDPHTGFKSIHIGGTNGKGSTSHMIASILQSAGYRVGLYTSPHLKSFTERIRINGVAVEETFVRRFVEDNVPYIENHAPSFFEVTVGMAFAYFSERQVDIAVIEVGMGGRLDSTNIINPLLSLITNISFDHVQYLGNTLPKIAFEKAGIIKFRVPSILVEEPDDIDVLNTFREIALEKESPFLVAETCYQVIKSEHTKDSYTVEVLNLISGEMARYELGLLGDYQQKNLIGVLTALNVLRSVGYPVSNAEIKNGLIQVKEATGIKGRWQVLGTTPFVVCDTAHNLAGIIFALNQFLKIGAGAYRFVLGFVSDKEVEKILFLFPKDAIFYFCTPSIQRAMPLSYLIELGNKLNLTYQTFENVNVALDRALNDSKMEDAIYVGGSTFVVAELNNL